MEKLKQIKKQEKHNRGNKFRRLSLGLSAIAVLSVLMLGLLTGCEKKDAAEEKAPVNVFAAASLTNVAEELAAGFTEKEGIPVLLNTASSSTLARQIEQGSSADIYFSANKKWADYLLDLEMLDKESVVVVAKNSLVVVVPAGSGDESDDVFADKDTLPADFLSSGQIALGDPDHVPAGMYAKDALTAMGVFSSIESRFLPCSSVREALLLVERGEAPWGIVYNTDALSAEGKVTTVGSFASELHKPIRYYLGIVNTGEENPGKELFYQYCVSEEGMAVYKKYGFLPAE